ncbi:hypothetical protein [Acinetobacter higginsii]|nr:hypothetical protein [Acinetobacter higginsii]MCI3880220.1 hypothetical protein [Acinetobacter higginsii]MDO3663124.1 hypothetical protein [Acinetobacter higginsii]
MTHITVDVTDYAERFYSDRKNEALFVPAYKVKSIDAKIGLNFELNLMA